MEESEAVKEAIEQFESQGESFTLLSCICLIILCTLSEYMRMYINYNIKIFYFKIYLILFFFNNITVYFLSDKYSLKRAEIILSETFKNIDYSKPNKLIS